MNAHVLPTPLEKLLGSEITGCPCGKVHRVPTREALLQPGAISELPRLATTYFPPGPLLFVLDDNTRAAAGQQAVELLEKNGRSAVLHFLDGRQHPVHADGRTVASVADAVRRKSCSGLVAVGSGTINDICKSAATAADRPLITVATAASMNGYPSAIAALTVDGVKITDPCRPPVAVIADPHILATAPSRMSAAGFGDLLSKNASTADWVMAHHLLDEYYCPVSAAVAETAVNRCIQTADRIKSRTPEGLAILAEALMRSGISMVMAGSSAPASGGEHLISHLWDMTAHWTERTPALHGEQTAVATLISLALYEKLLSLDDAEIRRRCRDAPGAQAPEEFIADMQSIFGDISAGVLPYARQKHLADKALLQRRNRIADRWEIIRREVSKVVVPALESRAHLEAAGAVTRLADLEISHQEAVFAYRNARWIRNRYTVLDLAAELNLLEAWQDDVLRLI